MKFVKFDEFRNSKSLKEISLSDLGESTLNEGWFDKSLSFFTKLFNIFKDPATLKTSLEKTIIEEGDISKKFLPKNIKINDTYVLNMGDGESTETNFSIGLTKLANLPDGTFLFQISGTTSEEMLKALTGSTKIEDLVKSNVMAIITQNGFVEGKAPTMRLVKNILPPSKDYTTKALFLGAAPMTAIEQTIKTQ